MASSVSARARQHAALGDPLRLAIVEDLVHSDRSPAEIGARHQVASNLLAHHLSVLETAGLITRMASNADRRRRYITADLAVVASLGMGSEPVDEPILFVCTQNSARSQLAAALWEQATGRRAESAGTHPARTVHLGAVAAARRAGLSLPVSKPRHLSSVPDAPWRLVTVCDQAHEELGSAPERWHWSVPDPTASAAREAFDKALNQLADRITFLTKGEAA